jgi:hypothetical protein
MITKTYSHNLGLGFSWKIGNSSFCSTSNQRIVFPAAILGATLKGAIVVPVDDDKKKNMLQHWPSSLEEYFSMYRLCVDLHLLVNQ